MCADTPDYKDTLFLPETEFPMRAGLPNREPDWLARWERIGIYDRLRETANGREPFILHDGPPYANGHLHIGHGLNKILKDMVVRSQQMMGKDSRICAGLGLPRSADRVEDRGTVPRQGPRQGRGPDQRVPQGMPRLRGPAGSTSSGRVQAPGRDRQVGRPLPHHELPRRGRDRGRVHEVL